MTVLPLPKVFDKIQKNKTLERFFEVILVLVLILKLSLLIYVRIIQLYELLKFNVLDEQVFQVKL